MILIFFFRFGIYLNFSRKPAVVYLHSTLDQNLDFFQSDFNSVLNSEFILILVEIFTFAFL